MRVQLGKLRGGTGKKNLKKQKGKKKNQNQNGLTFTHNTVLAWEEMDEQGQL